ncbi:hypothetical protein JCM11641_005112 [Rhodosporidiobolus odoratus]
MRAISVLTLGLSVGAAPLFTRQGDGYPAPETVGPTPKDEWVQTYQSARSAGKIPAFAPAQLSGTSGLYYTISGCFGDTDIFQAPNGSYGVSCDDGPLPTSPPLYSFLQQQNQTATHFLIGSNILNNPGIFRQVLETGGHLAVHTWSHPQMTTLSDTAILGELGWTIQIIHDYSGGYIPKYWRPPYGDADNRVRAIAEEVFGLTLVAWDQDSDDWCLTPSGGTSCGGEGPSSFSDLISVESWQNGNKSPGVLGLQHELSTYTVQGFIQTFANIARQGWTAGCIPDLFGEPWYLNALRDETADSTVQIGAGPHTLAKPDPSPATTSTADASSTPSSSEEASQGTLSASTPSGAGSNEVSNVVAIFAILLASTVFV